jgi:hypothetical protein
VGEELFDARAATGLDVLQIQAAELVGLAPKDDVHVRIRGDLREPVERARAGRAAVIGRAVELLIRDHARRRVARFSVKGRVERTPRGSGVKVEVIVAQDRVEPRTQRAPRAHVAHSPERRKETPLQKGARGLVNPQVQVERAAHALLHVREQVEPLLAVVDVHPR